MRRWLQNGPSIFFRRHHSILSAAFVIMVTYGLSHLAGLVKTRLLISYFFGSTSHLLDVYYAAFVIPDAIFQLLVIGSLSAAFIPIFSKTLSRNPNDAWTIANTSLNLVLLLFLLLSFLLFLLSPFLSRLIAPGFSHSQIHTMSSLLRLFLLAQFFFIISGFFTSIIQSFHRFLLPALAPLAYNLGIIAGIFSLAHSFGIYGPGLGVVLGAVLHMLIQLPLVIHLGFRPSFRLRLGTPEITQLIRLLPQRAAALGIDQIEQFVAVFLTSALASGSFALFNVARLLYALPASLFGVALGQAALPTLSRQGQDTDRQSFFSTLSSALLQTAFLALPVSVLFIILRIPIVRIVFGAKSFPWAATLLTGKAVAILAVSSTAAAMIQLVIRGFYALHDTRTPLIVGLFAAVFGSFLAVFSVNVLGFGLLGLVAVISLVSLAETLILFFLLLRSLRPDPKSLRRDFLRPLLTMLLVSALTGVSLWLPMRLLDRYVFDTTRTLPLLGLTFFTSLIGVLVYVFLCFIFKIPQIWDFLGLLRRLSRWRQLVTPTSAPVEPVILPAPDQN